MPFQAVYLLFLYVMSVCFPQSSVYLISSGFSWSVLIFLLIYPAKHIHII